MKKLHIFLLLSLIVTTSYAKKATFDFMTPRDLMHNDSASNINLHNSRSNTTTVYGLYIRQFGYVAQGDSCANAVTIYTSSTNTTAGAFVMPTTITPGKSAAVGKNFLYNMIYAVNYYVGIVYSSSPPGCALPGCTWGSDTTIYNWCIYLGALAPVANTADYTSNVPPSASLASSAGQYDYNLINNYVTLGPISCNDQSLTCSVTSPQTQSFS